MEKGALSSLKYVVILAVLFISIFQILCTEGRQIKSVDKQEFVHNIGEEAASPHFTPSSNHNTSVSVQQPDYTGKEEMPFSPPEAPASCIGYHDSAMAIKNDSQPTQTGSSLGIGHHFVGDSTDQDVDIPKSLGATYGLEHSVTPSTTYFRPPTQTGSSPGIGHQLVEDSADHEVDIPKSLCATSGLEHSVTPSTKDFPPTAPVVVHASEHKN